jgi:hypothetical protein
MGEWAEPFLKGIDADLDTATANMLDPENPIWGPLKLMSEELGIEFEKLYESTVALGGQPDSGFPYLGMVLTEQATDFATFMNLIETNTTTTFSEANKLIKDGAFTYNTAVNQAAADILMGAPINQHAAAAAAGIIGGNPVHSTPVSTQVTVPANQTTTNTTNLDVGGNTFEPQIIIDAAVASSMPQVLEAVNRATQQAFKDYRERTGGAANSFYRNQYS